MTSCSPVMLLVTTAHALTHSKFREEPVFSVTAASWFWEKSGGIEKVEDVKPVLLEKKRTDFNRQRF
jgi:hypothetical protein